MVSNYGLCAIILELFISFATGQSSEEAAFSPETVYTIPVSKFTVQQKIFIPGNCAVLVQAVEIPPDVRFVLTGAHTQKENVTVSYFSELNPHTSVSGTNIGLVEMLDGFDTSTETWIFNNNSINVSVLIVIIPYNSLAPIPGGCNMEFPIETSPFLRLYYNHASTRLEYQHANIGSSRGLPLPLCDSSIILLSYDVYVYFLKEGDFSEEEYFRGMKLMNNVTSIHQNAIKVKTFLSGPKTRIVFLSYPSQGAIYNIIAYYEKDGKSQMAAYVPIATYGCNFQSQVDGCGRLNSTVAKVLAIVCAAFGLIMCFRGHRLFKGEMFYFGFLSTLFIAFILATKYTALSSVDRDVFTICMGVLGGLFWLAVWWFLGIPIISMLLVGLVLGFLTTAIILFTPLGSYAVLTNDMNYWLILSCGMLLVSIILLPFTKLLSILGTAVVGSFAVIVAIDRYLGTTLFYIVINVVKRAVVDDLSTASNEFPFQQNDVILSAAWGALALLGCCFQLWSERKRPPFPPAPYITWKRNRQLRIERNSRFNHSPQLYPSAPYEESNEQEPLLSGNPNYGSIMRAHLDCDTTGCTVLNRQT